MDSAKAKGAERRDAASAAIEITAEGSRASLESLYLELRELAKTHGLKIDFRLSKNRPGS